MVIEQASDPLFRESGLDIAYYANSYVCRPDDAGSCARIDAAFVAIDALSERRW